MEHKRRPDETKSEWAKRVIGKVLSDRRCTDRMRARLERQANPTAYARHILESWEHEAKRKKRFDRSIVQGGLVNPR